MRHCHLQPAMPCWIELFKSYTFPIILFDKQPIGDSNGGGAFLKIAKEKLQHTDWHCCF